MIDTVMDTVKNILYNDHLAHWSKCHQICLILQFVSIVLDKILAEKMFILWQLNFEDSRLRWKIDYSGQIHSPWLGIKSILAYCCRTGRQAYRAVQRPFAGVNNIIQSGIMNLATANDQLHFNMNETPRRSIMVTSSLNEYPETTCTPFCSRLPYRYLYLKTTWTVFPPSRICSSCTTKTVD